MADLMLTHSRLLKDLQALGVRRDGVVMLHASLRAIGPTVGGPDVVIQALRDALGPRGTIMMYTGWEDGPFDLEDWPPDVQRVYIEECPPFDPATSRARRGHGALAEFLRTWPEAVTSNHPEAAMSAVGGRARWLTENHALAYGYGVDSPLAKLVEAEGQVLLLGAPLDTTTLLHHAEHIARLPDKKTEQFRVPITRGARRTEWIEIIQYDTSDGVVEGDYTLDQIAADALAHGLGRSGLVGNASSHIFGAAQLVSHAVEWLESRFGTGRSAPPA
jgi:aminoglycoside 3-N-acetyltransferase